MASDLPSILEIPAIKFAGVIGMGRAYLVRYAQEGHGAKITAGCQMVIR